MLHSLNGGRDAVEACVLHQLSVICVQMLTQLITVYELSQVFCVGDEPRTAPCSTLQSTLLGLDHCVLR
jgi:hypothetical protein